jgi:O-acetyl-ADP-ribose deacetylase (regulator of RNase III)
MYMKVSFEKGYAIEKPVQAVINSANWWLCHDSSGAGAIRKATRDLTKNETEVITRLYSQLSAEGKVVFEDKKTKGNWDFNYASLASLYLLKANKFQHYKLGDVICDEESFDDKKIFHIITVGHTIHKNKVVRVLASRHEILYGFVQMLKMIQRKGITSIALPVPVARKAYGLTPEESFEILTHALETISDTDISVTICFDNDETASILPTIQTTNDETKTTQ